MTDLTDLPWSSVQCNIFRCWTLCREKKKEKYQKAQFHPFCAINVLAAILFIYAPKTQWIILVDVDSLTIYSDTPADASAQRMLGVRLVHARDLTLSGVVCSTLHFFCFAQFVSTAVCSSMRGWECVSHIKAAQQSNNLSMKEWVILVLQWC